MIKVQVRPNEPLEAALRRFKRQCNFAGIFRLAKKYSFFEKRSDKNRREDRERVRAKQRAQRKSTQGSGNRKFSRKKARSKSNQNDGGSTEGISAVPASQLEARAKQSEETPAAAAPAATAAES